MAPRALDAHSIEAPDIGAPLLERDRPITDDVRDLGADAPAFDDRPAPPPAPERTMNVTVGDGVRTLNESQLRGSRVLALDRGLDFTLRLSDGGVDGAVYEVRYNGTQPADSKHVARFAPQGAKLVARIEPEDLVGIDALPLQFVITTTSAGAVSTPYHYAHDDNTPFAFRVDRYAPVAGMAIRSPNGVAIPLAWAANENESAVQAYRVQVREGTGAWTPWIDHTAENSATYSGQPGKTYAFRVAANDTVGHLSAWSEAPTTVTIPVTAPPNRPPVLTIVAPVEGAATRGPLHVEVDAVDPEATTPLVRACIVALDLDVACTAHASNTALDLEPGALGDGPVTLRVEATDGSLTTSALRVVALDRTPPAMRDVRAEPTEDGALLALVADATAVSAEITHADGARVGVVPLVSEEGVWTARPALAPDEYHVLFRARDAVGNEAASERVLRFSQPSDPADEARGSGDAATERATDAGVTPQEGMRTPSPFGIAVLGLALAALRRRL